MKVKRIQAILNCECPRKNTSFCNTEDCPIFRKFTDNSSVVDYFTLGLNKITFSFEIKEKK